MAGTLLDASAVLAAILEETGADVVVDALRSSAAMSAVNAAEVAARLHQEGWGDEEVSLVFRELGIRILPFDIDIALLSGRYRVATQSLGLGLGDRACLASAYIACLPVLTADKAWEQLNLPGVDIRCIR